MTVPVIIILFFTLVTLCLFLLKYRFRYWHNKDVPSFYTNTLLGNFWQLESMHHRTLIQHIYDRFKNNAKIAGFYIYTQPAAVILDLDLVKSILIKDFHKFSDRMSYHNENDILSRNLFNVEGSKWHPLRCKFSTAFTSSKIKLMFPDILAVATQLKLTFDAYLHEDAILNISDLSSRYTNDFIGTCAFGIQCNSLKDTRAECRMILSKITCRANFSIRWQLFKQTYAHMARFVGYKRYPQFIEDFFMRILKENVMARKGLNMRRNDFIDLLLDVKDFKNNEGNSILSYKEIAAQIFALFVAGQETSSLAIIAALYCLAANQNIQEKLRREILMKLSEHNNSLNYDALMEMSYLDQVISETLRLYPTLSFLQRHATADYEIADTNIFLKKGTQVLIPVIAIHHDANIYADPFEFRPERFHNSEIGKRHPQSFLGFGDGPRNCMGQRFAQVQVRVALVTLLSNYNFRICEKTVHKIEYSKHTFITKPLQDVWLQVKKLEK